MSNVHISNVDGVLGQGIESKTRSSVGQGATNRATTAFVFLYYVENFLVLHTVV